MMKKIIITLLSLLLLLSLCGCHGKSVETSRYEVPEEFDDSKNYEITFWAKNDSNQNQVAVYEKAIEEFEKCYPNVKVNLSIYTDYGRIYNDVITNISTNTTPNVCITYPDHIATYITGNGTVLNLNDVIDDPKYGLGGSEVRFDSVKKEDIVSEFFNEGYIGDNLYALPFMRSTEALYINKTYVEKLGYEIPDVLTWDFIFEVSDKAISTFNEDGTYFVNDQEVLIPFIYKSTDNMMIQMLKQLNADYSTNEGDILIFNDDTREILKEIGKQAELKAFSTFKISSYPANFLNRGQCLFAVDSTAGATWMGSKAPLLDIPEEELIDFETVVRMVPQYDVNNPQMISQGPSVCVFDKEDPNEVLAAWLFAQYLLTDSIQIGYSKTEGYLPVTLKARETSEYQSYINEKGVDNNEHYSIKIDCIELLMNNTKNTFTTPVFNGSASLRTASGQLIEETCKAIKRKKKVDDKFIDELYGEINSLYRLDQVGGQGVEKELGKLPSASKILIGSVCITWCFIGIYLIYKNKKNKA